MKSIILACAEDVKECDDKARCGLGTCIEAEGNYSCNCSGTGMYVTLGYV